MSERISSSEGNQKDIISKAKAIFKKIVDTFRRSEVPHPTRNALLGKRSEIFYVDHWRPNEYFPRTVYEQVEAMSPVGSIFGVGSD